MDNGLSMKNNTRLLPQALLAYMRAEPGENMSYVICEQQRRRSACASAQSDQRLYCSLPI